MKFIFKIAAGLVLLVVLVLTNPALEAYRAKVDAMLQEARSNAAQNLSLRSLAALTVIELTKHDTRDDLVVFSRYSAYSGNSKIVECYGVLTRIWCHPAESR